MFLTTAEIDVSSCQNYFTLLSCLKFFQLEEARHLDQRQKQVLSIGIKFARGVVTFKNSKSPNFSSTNLQQAASATSYLQNSTTSTSNLQNIICRPPSPPLVFVTGGAGSGKSRLINSLYTMMTEILKREGDDPCCPYIVLSSFTGAASANINGQTLHSLFGFKFGNSFLSMPD